MVNRKRIHYTGLAIQIAVYGGGFPLMEYAESTLLRATESPKKEALQVLEAIVISIHNLCKVKISRLGCSEDKKPGHAQLMLKRGTIPPDWESEARRAGCNDPIRLVELMVAGTA